MKAKLTNPVGRQCYLDLLEAGYSKKLLEDILDVAFEEGKREAKARLKMGVDVQIAAACKSLGVAIDIISVATGLSKSEIENL